MNTKILYQYRDAGNNKVLGEFVLTGRLTDEQIRSVENSLAIFPENGLLPSKVGLPSLIGEFVAGSEFDPELDHEWHEWIEASETDEAASTSMSVDQFMENWDKVAREGWDALDCDGAYGANTNG